MRDALRCVESPSFLLDYLIFRDEPMLSVYVSWVQSGGSSAKVHYMHLGPKISGVELAFLSAGS